MKLTNLLRKGLSLLLALSVILTMGTGAFAAPAGEDKTVTRAGEGDDYGSTKTLYTGTNQEDDYFTLQLDAFQRSTVDVTKTGVPLDVTIVLDRSQSMSQPASEDAAVYKSFPSYYPGAILYKDSTYGWWTFDHSDIVESANIKTQMEAINAYLDTLDKTKYEGYYRATNYLKRGRYYFIDNHVGCAAAGFASWEPLRYNQTTKQWEMRVTNGLWGGDFPGGINTMDYTGGSIKNNEVEWMSVTEAYKEYCARNRRNIYTGQQVYPDNQEKTGYTGYYDFVITTPRLTKAVDATESFIRSIYESNKSLPAGQTHRVSILSFGTGAFYVGGRYAYNTYDAATDKAVKVEAVLKEDLGVSKTITDLNSEANLNSVLNVLHSHYTYTNTRTDWALDAVESETSFLPDNTDKSRKQVVILITDGAPTYSDNMQLDVANSALASAKKLKDAEVDIYTIGFMPGLDDTASPTAFNASDPGSPANANSFLVACSSMYSGASAMGSYGDADTSGTPFYKADDGSGDKLAGIFDTMKEFIIETAVSPYFYDADSLYIFDEITREFSLNAATGSIKVYADPYKGGNTYDSRKTLGTHSFTEPKEGTPVTITGKGYTITLTKKGELTQVKLDWTDAECAFLREQDYNAGGEYSSTYPKGYKIVLELPLVVNRDNTLGGNNINTNTTDSGFYLPPEGGSGSGTDTGLGSVIVDYPVPNANVKFNVDPVVYDYFMDLKDYVATYQNAAPGSAEAQAVYEAMYQTLAELQKYLENHKNDYLGIDIDLLNALGQLLDGMHANAGATAYTPDNTASGATFDFLADQVLSFVVTLTPTTSNNDSCADANNGAGVEPYAPQKDQLAPNYYGPKYVVVDFDEDVKVDLDNEADAALNAKVIDNKLGTVENGKICYDFREIYNSGDKQFLEGEYATVKYQVTAKNAPKAQNGVKTVNRNFYVFPANVMTYDDTLLKFVNGNWETVGQYTDGEQSHDNSVTHGYDPLYNTYSKEYYHNALKAVTVSRTNGTAQATFSITGTGFDIFAQTGPNSGTMAVEVSYDSGFAQDYKTFLVDTYLKDATLNQIPVVRVDDLPYGTWYIRITAFYDSVFDHNYVSQWKNGGLTEEKLRDRYDIPADADFTFIPSESGYDHPATRLANAKDGQYNVYIDGIRVYNTLGTSLDAVEAYAYAEAGEGVASIVNMNDRLVDAGSVTTWSGSGVDGVLYSAVGGIQVNYGETVPGIILGMDGELYAKRDNSKFYLYKDAELKQSVTYNGNKVYYRKQNVTAPSGRVFEGKNYFYENGGEKTPMTTKQIREAFGSMPIYYNAKYSQMGPEKEVYLSKGHGVAFAVSNADKVMVSFKSHNGSPATLSYYNGSGYTAIATTSSRVEMYYDITSAVRNGMVFLQSTEGTVAVCNIKTTGAEQANITVSSALITEAAKAFKNAGLPVDESADIMHTLDLASDISMNYVVPTTKLADYDYSFMEVSFNGATYLIEPEIRGDYGYFTVNGITAVDMTEELTATLHLFLGEEEFVSETDVYSVADYAYAQLAKADVSDELKAVCANLLRYGTQAQSFKGSDNAPADAAMTDEQKAYVTDLNTVSVVCAAKALSDVENGVAWAGKVLVLDSKVAIKAVFNLKDYAGNKEALNLRATYINGKGEEVTILIDNMEVYNADFEQYAFVIDSLLATEMRSVLTMALYEGETQVSETQLYSVESYCVGKPAALADLGKALLAYSDAAKAFFAN